MKSLIVFASLIAVLAADTPGVCFKDGFTKCNEVKDARMEDCNAKFGGLFYNNDATALNQLSRYVGLHLHSNFQYLLMATRFGNYKVNRAGFEKKFREMSDSAWNDAIDIAKYLTKRGGAVKFDKVRDAVVSQMEKRGTRPQLNSQTAIYELSSLADALDIQKYLAREAHRIHFKVSSSGGGRNGGEAAAGADKKRDVLGTYDPDVASYMENNFLHKLSDSIRTLSGYTNDLKHLMTHEHHTPLAVFLFDEYLQKY